MALVAAVNFWQRRVCEDHITSHRSRGGEFLYSIIRYSRQARILYLFGSVGAMVNFITQCLSKSLYKGIGMNTH